MVFAAFIVTVEGFVDPERLPDQLVKAYPEEPAAEREMPCPLLYQLVPAGLTAPPLVGLPEVVRLYWVVKLAVYVALQSDLDAAVVLSVLLLVMAFGLLLGLRSAPSGWFWNRARARA
jgi:hypothetical protein